MNLAIDFAYLLYASFALSSFLLFWKSAAPFVKTNAGRVTAEKTNFFVYIFYYFIIILA